MSAKTIDKSIVLNVKKVLSKNKEKVQCVGAVKIATHGKLCNMHSKAMKSSSSSAMTFEQVIKDKNSTKLGKKDLIEVKKAKSDGSTPSSSKGRGNIKSKKSDKKAEDKKSKDVDDKAEDKAESKDEDKAED